MPLGLVTAAQDMTKQLGGAWHESHGLARCPAHADQTPSLSIKPGHSAVLFHCFAGCSQDAIMNALRLGQFSTALNDVSELPHNELSRLVASTWAKARPVGATPAERYLASRRIANHATARFIARAVTYENGRRMELPALVLPLHRHSTLVALSRIFIDETGAKNRLLQRPKRILGSHRGAAIKIGRQEGHQLFIAEGYEDAESVKAMFGLSHCWAVTGNELYASLVLPPLVRQVTIFSQHGKAAANGVDKARAHFADQNATLTVELPPPSGDWNDAWRV
jgi:putative DNA primase/helicase